MVAHLTLKNSTTQPRQRPVDLAPRKVREHGLRDAHSYPLVSMGKAHSREHGASFRVPADKAWAFPEIELRSGNSWPAIVLDVDGANALYRIVDAVEHGEILTPNWTVSRKSGGTHAVWTLNNPVHRGEKARRGPLRFLSKISEYYADKLKADPSYNSVLCHNPMASAHGPRFFTNWFHRQPYALPQLAEVIPLGWKKPRIANTAIGRNCTMFDTLVKWAGKPENRKVPVLTAAHSVNAEIGRSHGKIPLPHSELIQVARSVERYRREWVTEGGFYSAEERRLWAQRRQSKGVVNRRMRGDLDNRDRAIQQDYLQGMKQRSLADKYSLSQGRVSRIITLLHR